MIKIALRAGWCPDPGPGIRISPWDLQRLSKRQKESLKPFIKYAWHSHIDHVLQAELYFLSVYAGEIFGQIFV